MESSSEPGHDVPPFCDIDIEYEPRPIMDPVPRIFFATRTHREKSCAGHLLCHARLDVSCVCKGRRRKVLSLRRVACSGEIP
eukprot:scaffold12191_cov22-Tisochrysis_lutea.AAC.1